MTSDVPRTGYDEAAAPSNVVGAPAPSGPPARKFIVAPVVPAPAGGASGVAVGFVTMWADYRTWLLLHTVCTAATCSQYRKMIWAFCDPRGGYLARLRRPKRWDQADSDDLLGFLDREVSTGPRRGLPLSAAYRSGCITAIQSFYRYAYAAGVLRRDPMALVHHPRVRVGAPRALTDEELRVVLMDAEPDARLSLCCWLGYAATLRSMEIAGLHDEDVYLDPWPGRLHVLGKGQVERWVPLHAGVRAALDRYTARRPLTPGAPLVDNRRWPGSPLLAGSVARLLGVHLRSSIGHGSSHDLRHTGATAALAAAEGANLEEVRELLGHTETRTTRRYVSAYQWKVRERAVDLIPDPRSTRRT